MWPTTAGKIISPRTLLLLGAIALLAGFFWFLPQTPAEASQTLASSTVTPFKPPIKLAVPPSKFTQDIAFGSTGNQAQIMTINLGPAVPQVRLVKSAPVIGNDATGYTWTAEIGIDTMQPIRNLVVSARGKGITFISLAPTDGSNMSDTSQQFHDKGSETASYKVGKPAGNYIVSVKTLRKAPQPILSFALDAA
jgi:hypothetical protein